MPPENPILAKSRSLIEPRPQPWEAPAGRRHGRDSPQRRRNYPAAVRAVLFVKPTTVASWHRKRWTTLEETSVAVASPPTMTSFPVFGALREREMPSSWHAPCSEVNDRMARLLTEHDGSQRLGLRAWIAALGASPADLKPGLRQIQVSGDIQKSMETSGVAITDRYTRLPGTPCQEGTS